MTDDKRIVYVTGIDGSGKTTACGMIGKHLQEQGYEVETLWLRFNHFYSKPLLALCRLIGLTKYETVDGVRIGYHHFYRSRLISWLFIRLQYMDARRVLKRQIMPRLKRPGKRTIILDRYVIDILIDVSVDTGINLFETAWKDRFMSLLPEGSQVLLIKRDYETVCQVRPEAQPDKLFKKRYDYFESISEGIKLHIIDNNSDLGVLKKMINELTKVNSNDWK